jgi:hypothetical protein
MVGVPETTGRDLEYHALPDDLLAALKSCARPPVWSCCPLMTPTEESVAPMGLSPPKNRLGRVADVVCFETPQRNSKTAERPCSQLR